MNAIAGRRLRNQLLARAGLGRPADVVSWLGAVQAQEYEPAKWALGLRMNDGAVDAEIEGAFEAGRILRTHVMRPTWHFVTPADIRWMLELTAPRVHLRMSPYNRRLGLDTGVFIRGTRVIERALRDRRHLTRPELGERLRRSGLDLDGMRLAHLVMYAELEGVICSGPRRATKFTYALLPERAPKASRLPRDEAVATLVRRYFSSHGPATIQDFVWWSGLETADAKRGLEMTRARREEIGNTTYWTNDEEPGGRSRGPLVQLLPIYDEYLVAYRRRNAVPHGPYVIPSRSRGFVSFQHALLVAGQVGGTWRRSSTKRDPSAVSIEAIPLRPLTERERRALGEAVRRYERFLCRPVELTVD